MYSEKSDNELLDLLDKAQMLTFESQLRLNTEIDKRNLAVDKSGLETIISEKLTSIKNLEHLRDFGFEASFNDGGIEVTRTQKAVLLDVLAMVMGLVVFLVGVYGIASLVSIVVNGEDFNVFSLALDLAMASLVVTGFKFFQGLKRLLDFTGFSLSNDHGMVTLKKRFDLKLEEIRDKATNVLLESHGGTMELKLDHRTIFKSNPESLTQRLTLEELVKKLKI